MYFHYLQGKYEVLNYGKLKNKLTIRSKTCGVMQMVISTFYLVYVCICGFYANIFVKYVKYSHRCYLMNIQIAHITIHWRFLVQMMVLCKTLGLFGTLVQGFLNYSLDQGNCIPNAWACVYEFSSKHVQSFGERFSVPVPYQEKGGITASGPQPTRWG